MVLIGLLAVAKETKPQEKHVQLKATKIKTDG
jgi:hypothetical protein